MHKVDERVAEQLWERDGDQIRFVVEQAVRGRGVPREKGQTAKQALEKAVLALVRVAYLAGLQRGYQMGARVFGDQTDDSKG